MAPLVGKVGFDYRFDVASRVMAARAQDIHVQLILPWSGPGQGQIGVRVGSLLVYRANRQALGILDAWGKAGALADEAFGPDLLLPAAGEAVSADWSGRGRLGRLERAEARHCRAPACWLFLKVGGRSCGPFRPWRVRQGQVAATFSS